MCKEEFIFSALDGCQEERDWSPKIYIGSNPSVLDVPQLDP